MFQGGHNSTALAIPNNNLLITDNYGLQNYFSSVMDGIMATAPSFIPYLEKCVEYAVGRLVEAVGNAYEGFSAAGGIDYVRQTAYDYVREKCLDYMQENLQEQNFTDATQQLAQNVLEQNSNNISTNYDDRDLSMQNKIPARKLLQQAAGQNSNIATNHNKDSKHSIIMKRKAGISPQWSRQQPEVTIVAYDEKGNEVNLRKDVAAQIAFDKAMNGEEEDDRYHRTQYYAFNLGESIQLYKDEILKTKGQTGLKNIEDDLTAYGRQLYHRFLKTKQPTIFNEEEFKKYCEKRHISKETDTLLNANQYDARARLDRTFDQHTAKKLSTCDKKNYKVVQVRATSRKYPRKTVTKKMRIPPCPNDPVRSQENLESKIGTIRYLEVERDGQFRSLAEVGEVGAHGEVQKLNRGFGKRNQYAMNCDESISQEPKVVTTPTYKILDRFFDFTGKYNELKSKLEKKCLPDYPLPRTLYENNSRSK